MRVWTYQLAMAAGKDAANRSMRKAGRAAWNDDDWNAMVATVDRLFPMEIRGIVGTDWKQPND